MNPGDIDLMVIQTGEQDRNLLTGLLVDSESRILSLTNRSKMIPPLEIVARDYAVVAYNRLGAEGDKSRTEGGITSVFAEIPKSIQDTINQYRLARAGGHAHEKESDADGVSEETP